MTEETKDVQNVETTTTDSSSEQNTSENSQETAQPQENTNEANITKDFSSNFVPYDRFKEKNEEAKKLKEELDRLQQERQLTQTQQQQNQTIDQEQVVKEQLKKLGFVSKEELQEVEADRQLSNTLEKLESKYDGKDGAPKFKRSEILKYARDNMIGDIEAAYKLKHQVELTDIAIKRALGKVPGVKSEVSDGSGSATAGTSNNDLKAAIEKGDKGALTTYIKRQL
jgi:hypothetical protein